MHYLSGGIVTLKSSTRKLTRAAIVGAAYAALTLFGSVFGITYGPIQCRFSEALCVLPFIFPETAWGLAVGCLIANLLSPYGLLDLVVGTLATLIAALLTRRCRSKYLAPLPPVLCNGLLVGAMLAYEEVGFGSAFASAFWFNACSVSVGDAISCYMLGLLLLGQLQKSRFVRDELADRE